MDGAITGTNLDARKGRPPDVSEGWAWGSERTVRAEVLEDLLAGAHGSVHWRGVYVQGAHVQGPLDLSWLQLGQPLSFVECYFDGSVVVKGATLKELVLSGSRVSGLDLSRATVEGSVLLDEGFFASGEVLLAGAEIGGRLSCRRATLTNERGRALDAGGVTVASSVILDELTASGAVGVPGADIGGELSCRKALLQNRHGVSLDVGGATVASSVILDELTASGAVGVPGAEIGGELSCRKALLQNRHGVSLDAGGATVARSAVLEAGFSATGTVCLASANIKRLAWNDEHVDGVLDLSDATVQQLQDHWGRPLRHGTRLSGFRYEYFVGTEEDVEFRLAWVRSSPGATRQPYTQLASVYRRSGQDAWARKVLIAREWDLSWRDGAKLWSRAKSVMFRAAVGYGYKPVNAVLWLIVLWLILAALLDRDAGRRVMVATKAPALVQSAAAAPAPAPTATSCPPQYSCFNPLIYSAETVIPLISLGQTDKWQLSGGATRYQVAVWSGTALGWLLTTLGAAGVTGIIRKD